jgi:hypothetical protein
MNLSYSDPSCPQCWHFLAIGWRGGPAPDVVQDAVGCSSVALARFFDPPDWWSAWTLPLTVVFGTSAEWRTVAGWWRETRERREGRYLSLAEINAGWDGG